MPPYFQQHTIEVLLFIYGESRDFDALCGLFEKQVMAFPLERAHYEWLHVPPHAPELLASRAARAPAHARAVQSTGQILLGGHLRARVSKGGGNGVREQVTVAVNQVQGKTPKGIRRINRNESADHALNDERIFSPEDLARIALFRHRYGLPMTLELVDKLGWVSWWHLVHPVSTEETNSQDESGAELNNCSKGGGACAAFPIGFIETTSQ
ncbi:hypothetical protein PsorP6_015659 [Peronosclerospora sorghi]|uniref:Uncharacterized protein n=1 Tax=Peronosclerospora sorghi TaxID=230839 RepID=A0ACC0WQN7_9STRA|nr:hypothetical protein PsorP6_015659 [Peronosclerospora sorghi]